MNSIKAPSGTVFHLKDSAHQRRLSTWRTVGHIEGFDPKLVLQSLRADVEHLADAHATHLLGLRIQLTLCASIVQTSPDCTLQDAYFNGPLLDYFDEDWFDETTTTITQNVENYLKNSSGHIIDSFKFVEVSLATFNRFSKLKGWGPCPLPDELKNKKAVLSVISPNGLCFKYAVLAAKFHDRFTSKEATNYHNYDRFEEFNFSSISFPASPREAATQFQNKNPRYCLNIFLYSNEDEESEKLQCIFRPSPHKANGRTLINLLLFNLGKAQNADYMHCHYLPILNLDRLLNESGERRQFCNRCLRPFYTHRVSLEKHMQECYQGSKVTKELLPPEGTKISFTNQRNKLSPNFCIYADFESLIVDNDSPILENKHVPHAAGFLVKANQMLKDCPLADKYFYFKGEKCIEKFREKLHDISQQIYEFNCQHANKVICMTPEDEETFQQAANCYCCGIELENDVKVRDHCHTSGTFRGAACISCNSRLRSFSRTIPVIFHNFQGYDCHLLLKYGNFENKHLHVLARNSENYISLTWSFPAKQHPITERKKKKKKKQVIINVKFIDSYQHLSMNLAGLAANLETLPNAECMKKSYPNVDDDILSRKGFFPYEYANSTQRLSETCLPAHENFFSSLSGENISRKDYDHALRAFQKFGCQNIEAYMLCYLELDVRLLADVFEQYREMCLKEFGLDSVNYITLPSFVWDAAFSSCGVELDALSDLDMYQAFERGIRGGSVFVNRHYVSANCREMGSSYDPTSPLEYILPIDANNLYGAALSAKLPHSNFHFLENPESFDVNSVDIDGEYGYFVICDLEYPPEIHDRTAQFPLAPEPLSANISLFTPYMNQQWSRLTELRGTGTKFSGTEKLMLTQFNKQEYGIHFSLLQFYLKLGLKITKIHNVVAFRQEAIFEDYISRNSSRRKEATNDFQKDFWKLMNNSLFGKTMEDVRKRVNLRLATNAKRCEQLVRKPEHIGFQIFTEHLSAHTLAKTKVELCKPIYIGQCVLDISKLIMYRLWYETLAPEIISSLSPGASLEICASDTDSFFLDVKNLDVPNVLLPYLKDKGVLDTSNYPMDHLLYSSKYKAQLGCIKDESAGGLILEAIFLKPKLYSLLGSLPEQSKKRAKSIAKAVLKNEVSHMDYLDAYVQQTEKSAICRRIGSKRQQVYTVATYKRALSFFDDKRSWVTENTSLPFGHYSLRQTKPTKEKVVPPTTVNSEEPGKRKSKTSLLPPPKKPKAV